MIEKINLLAIRHGQTIWGSQKILQGHFDSPLTKLGQQQSIQATFLLKDMGVDVIVSSDLGRSVETAYIISSILRKKLSEKLIFFRERNLGILQGKKKEEVAGHNPNNNILGLEPETLFSSRIRRGLAYLGKKYPYETVVLITHGGVIRWLYNHSVLNIDYATIHEF